MFYKVITWKLRFTNSLGDGNSQISSAQAEFQLVSLGAYSLYILLQTVFKSNSVITGIMMKISLDIQYCGKSNTDLIFSH